MASSDSNTLIYNSAKIEDLAVELNGLLNQFKDEVEEMFNVIDHKMNQPYHWSGSVYETFKSKCDNFRKSEIESMISNIQAYIDHFHMTSEESEATTAKNTSIVEQDAQRNVTAINANINNPNTDSTTGII